MGPPVLWRVLYPRSTSQHTLLLPLPLSAVPSALAGCLYVDLLPLSSSHRRIPSYTYYARRIMWVPLAQRGGPVSRYVLPARRPWCDKRPYVRPLVEHSWSQCVIKLAWPLYYHVHLYRGPRPSDRLYIQARAHEPHASNRATQACTHARTYASNAPLLAGRFPRTTQPDSPLSFPRSVSQARPTHRERERESPAAPTFLLDSSCHRAPLATTGPMRSFANHPLSLSLWRIFFFTTSSCFSLSCFPLALFSFCYRWVVWNSRR